VVYILLHWHSFALAVIIFLREGIFWMFLFYKNIHWWLFVPQFMHINVYLPVVVNRTFNGWKLSEIDSTFHRGLCWVVHKVMDLIPAVTKGEAFEDALVRLRRCINVGHGPGGGVDDDDDDSDLEVITESITVSLRCPVRLPCYKDMILPC
jgi:hypothetical protein